MAGGSQPGNPLVAVIGQHEEGAGRQWIEHGGNGRHAGGEGNSVSALQATHDLLEGFPGGSAVVSGVGSSGAENVVGSRHQRHVQGRAGRRSRPAETSQESMANGSFMWGVLFLLHRADPGRERRQSDCVERDAARYGGSARGQGPGSFAGDRGRREIEGHGFRLPAEIDGYRDGGLPGGGAAHVGQHAGVGLVDHDHSPVPQSGILTPQGDQVLIPVQEGVGVGGFGLDVDGLVIGRDREPGVGIGGEAGLRAGGPLHGRALAVAALFFGPAE